MAQTRPDEFNHTHQVHTHHVNEALRAIECSLRIRPEDRADFRHDAWIYMQEHKAALSRWLELSRLHHAYLRKALQRFAIAWLRKHTRRWRPSAAAKRRGAVAIEIERLVARDGWPLAQAIDCLHVKLGGTVSRRALDFAIDDLRLNPPLRVVTGVNLDGLPSSSMPPEAEFLGEEAAVKRFRIAARLQAAYQALDLLDQRILALKFARGMTMAEIGRRLDASTDGVQKRYQRLKCKLRVRLAADGITPADVAAVLQGPEIDICLFEPVPMELDRSHTPEAIPSGGARLLSMTLRHGGSSVAC